VNRTNRFFGGLSLGYLYLGLVTVVGLWITPFLLGRVGTHDYGLWLVTSQILGYLMLLDLGVVALVPREAAYATGRALSGADGDDLARTLARFRRIVRWQLAPTAVISLVAWWLVASTWPELRWPLAAILTAFVVAFPVRIYHAALQGLQDLVFLGKVQLVAWMCGTSVTIALVLQGVGLGALASGVGGHSGRERRRMRHSASPAVPALVAVGTAIGLTVGGARHLCAIDVGQRCAGRTGAAQRL
jgi:hypothetical protein